VGLAAPGALDCARQDQPRQPTAMATVVNSNSQEPAMQQDVSGRSDTRKGAGLKPRPMNRSIQRILGIARVGKAERKGSPSSGGNKARPRVGPKLCAAHFRNCWGRRNSLEHRKQCSM